MSCTRSQIVAQMQAWIGCKESDGSHKKIIDLYNSHTPLARGYKLKYTDAWCAGTVSAAAIACKATDIIPTEVGCSKMIELFKKLGRWQENDAHRPEPGDVIFYDWQDNGQGDNKNTPDQGDNKNTPDHVGIVEKVTGNTITVIEGNYQNAVKRRPLKVNGKYIRGYGVPEYDAEEGEAQPAEPVKPTGHQVQIRALSRGSEGEDVRALQILLNGRGYSCGSADGDFGSKTDSAVRRYQKAKGLAVDGSAGPATMASLLGY